MKIIEGNGITLAGAKKGEHILLRLTNGETKRVILADVTMVGIEGYSTTIIKSPLKFYPFSNILEVTKDDEVDDTHHVLRLK